MQNTTLTTQPTSFVPDLIPMAYALAAPSAGETPLALASATGKPAAARYLLSQGTDVTLRRQPGGPAAIHRAAVCDDPTLLDLLAAAGADVCMPSDTGSPLSWAASAGQEKSVEKLLALGASEWRWRSMQHAWTRTQCMTHWQHEFTVHEASHLHG